MSLLLGCYKGAVSQRDARRTHQNVDPGHEAMKAQEGLIRNIHSSPDRYNSYEHHVSTSTEKLYPGAPLGYERQARNNNHPHNCPPQRTSSDFRSPIRVDTTVSDHDIYSSSSNKKTSNIYPGNKVSPNRRYSDSPQFSHAQMKPLQSSGSHPHGLDFSQTPPPKPPRRHQSLNRIHIPEDQDEGELSDNDSYKEWQNSPLVGKDIGSSLSGRSDRGDRERNYERDRYFDAPISRSASDYNVLRLDHAVAEGYSGIFSPTYQDAPISRSKSDREFFVVEPDRRTASRSQPITIQGGRCSQNQQQNQGNIDKVRSDRYRSDRIRSQQHSTRSRSQEYVYDAPHSTPASYNYSQSPSVTSPIQSPTQRKSNHEMHRALEQERPLQRQSRRDVFIETQEYYTRKDRLEVEVERRQQTSSQTSLHLSNDHLHSPHNHFYTCKNAQGFHGVSNNSYVPEEDFKPQGSYNHLHTPPTSRGHLPMPQKYADDHRVNYHQKNHNNHLPQSYHVPQSRPQRPQHLSLNEYSDANYTYATMDEKLSIEHNAQDQNGSKSVKVYPQQKSLDHSFKFQTIENSGRMQSQPNKIQDQQEYATSKETVYDNLYPSYQQQFSRLPVVLPEKDSKVEHLRKCDSRDFHKSSPTESPCSTDSEIRALNEPVRQSSKWINTENVPEHSRFHHGSSLPERDILRRQKNVDEHEPLSQVSLERADTAPVSSDVWVQRDDFSPQRDRISKAREGRASPLTGRRMLIPKQPARNLNSQVNDEKREYTKLQTTSPEYRYNHKGNGSLPEEQLQWVYSGLPPQKSLLHGKGNPNGNIVLPKTIDSERHSDSPHLQKQYTIPGNFKLQMTEKQESVSSPENIEIRSLSESRDSKEYEVVKPRGRLKNRYSGSLSAPGRRSKSLPRIAQQSEDLCYSASNLAHYSKVRSESVDELSEASLVKGEPVSPGALLFAQKRLEKDLADLAETHTDSVEKFDNSPEAGSVWIKREEQELLKQHRVYKEHRTKKQEEILSEMTSLNPDFVNTSPFLQHRNSHRFEHDVEKAIDELENFHHIVDKEADNVLQPKHYKPYDHRSNEMPAAIYAEDTSKSKDLKSQITLAQRKRRGKRDQPMSGFGKITTSKSLDSITDALRASQEFLPFRQAQHSNLSTQSSLSKSTESLHSPRRSRRSYAKRDARSSSEEDWRNPRRSLSYGSLYKQPHFDNMGFSSDSSPSSPVRLVHHRKVKTKSLIGIPLNFGSKESIPLNTNDELTPDGFSGEPVIEPELVKIVLEVEETSPSIFDKLISAPVSTTNLSVAMPGVRYSVASVSSIDSQVLSKPFEEMDAEYNYLAVDHRVDVSSDDDPGDITPEDLVQVGGTISALCFPRHLIKPDAKKPPIYPKRSSGGQSPSSPKEQSTLTVPTIIKNLPDPNSFAPIAFEESLSDTDGNNTDPDAPRMETPDDGTVPTSPCDRESISDSQIKNQHSDRVGIVAPRLKIQSETQNSVPDDKERGYYDAYKADVDNARRDLEIPEAPQLAGNIPTESGDAPDTFSSESTGENKELEKMDRTNNRSVKPVARLRDKFSDRPSSYHTSSERQQRFLAARPSSGSYSLRGDSYESHSSRRYSGDYTRYSTRDRISSADSPLSSDRYKSRSPLSSTTDHVTSRNRTRPSSLTGSFDSKRASTESGYGSLEKEKKRSNRATDPSYSSHITRSDKSETSTQSLTDKYLGARSTNGDLTSPRYSPTSPKYPSSSRKMGGTLATTASEKLSQLRQHISGSESAEDAEARTARITKYKEQRRRELAEKYGIGLSPSSSENDLTGRQASQSGLSKERKYSENDTKKSLEESKSKAPLAKEESVDSVSSKSSIKVKTDDDDVFVVKEDSPNTKLAIDSSVISQETKQLVTALEASRAARRERMRRAESIGETETEKILARHKTRKISDGEKKSMQTQQEAGLETHSSISSSELPLTSLPSQTKPEPEVIEERRADEVAPPQADKRDPTEDITVPAKEISQTRTSRQRDRHRKQCVPITQEELRKARELEFGIETKFGPDICDESAQEPAIEEQRQWAEQATKTSLHQVEPEDITDVISDDEDMMHRQKRELSRREQDAIRIHLDRVNKAKAAKDGGSPRKLSTAKSERISVDKREEKVATRKVSSSSRQRNRSPILSPEEGSPRDNRLRKRSDTSRPGTVDVTSSPRLRSGLAEKEKKLTKETSKASKIESEKTRKLSSSVRTEIKQEKSSEKKSPERKKSTSTRIERKEISTNRQTTQKTVSTAQQLRQEKKSVDAKDSDAITRKAKKLSDDDQNEVKLKTNKLKERSKSEVVEKPGNKLIKDTKNQSSNVTKSSSSEEGYPSHGLRRHGSLRTKTELEKDKSKFNALQVKDDELLSMMKLRRAQLVDGNSDSQEDEKQTIKKSEEITKVNVSERLEKFKQIDSSQSDSQKQLKSAMRKSCSFDLPAEEQGTDDNKDVLSSLSISQKKIMFAKIAVDSSTPPPSPKPVHKCVQRLRTHDRWQTQPVTPEELTDAANWAQNQTARSQSSISLTSTTAEVQEDEFSKLTLSEKMKLFKEKAEETKKEPPPKRSTPRRKKRTESRFKTQPVTIEEVKKAGSFSPLACSFAKPPDPELLANLPLADQIKLVFNQQNAEKNSLSGSRGSLSLSGSRGSITERRDSQSDSKDPKAGELDNRNFTPPSSPSVHRSILKKQPSGESTEGDGADSPRSILKIERKDSFNNVVRHESVKVERSLADDSIRAERVRSILKSEQELTIETEKDVSSILRKNSGADKKDVEGILRKDSESDQKKESVESRSILKRDTSKDRVEVSGILKREAQEVKEVKQEPSNGILKRSTENKVKHISRVSADLSSSESETEVRKRKKSKEEKKGTRRALSKESGKPDRYKTQPVDAHKQEKEVAKKPVKKLSPSSQRFQTQPVTHEEMAQVKQLVEPSKSRASITERLQNLKQNGEEGWKTRLKKYEDSPKSTTLKDRLSALENNASLTTNGDAGQKLGIAERLQALQQSGEHSWKSRVQKKDIDQFTVQGKLEKAGKSSDSSSEKLSVVNLNRKRPGSFRTISQKKEKSEEKENETKKNQINGNIKVIPTKSKFVQSSSSTTTTATESSESEPEVRLIKKKIAVLVPADEKFEEFFQSSSKTISSTSKTTRIEKVTSVSQEMTVSDFDLLTKKSGPRLDSLVSTHKRTIRPQRRARGSLNPVKALQKRENVQSEYTEERKEVVQVQTKTQSQKSIGGKQTDFTGYSLAYFTSRMDLKRVSLRKTGDVRAVEGLMLPYKDLMLMQIKGRKSVQARLVEPIAKSLNSGDCFVLVTSKQIFCWQGEYANILEKSKAADFAQYTLTKKDLGCKATEVHVIQENKTKFGRPVREFFKLLGGEDSYDDVRGAEEDEIQEIYINETNMIYRLKNEQLQPYKDYWEQIPKYEMFNSNEILVFDFGAELYLWQGRCTSAEDRKLGLKLSQLLWEQGYDYSDYDINPIFPSDPEKSKKGKSRPDWALFAKMNERMETILFQCKFDDWPNDSRLIRVKSQDGSQKKEPMPELVAWDAKKMVAPSRDKGYLILEGTNLGRGTGTASLETPKPDIEGYVDKFQSRGHVVVTISVATWHIMEFERSIMPKECFGQLHEGDTYVVRWQYRIEGTGMRDLKGNVSTRGIGHGKEKCAYFFWQGSRSTINEQGASALMTVELDDERGPQVRVIQGKEHSAFLNLFEGSLIVHMGKREEEDTNTQGSYRLYMARAEEENEGYLLELPCIAHSLRSRSSFVLLNLEKVEKKEVEIYVWHGIKSSEASQKVARRCANKMKENMPLEAGLNQECTATIHEMEEGKEHKTFNKIFKMERKSYDSAIGDPMEFDFTPRLFHLTSTSGIFKAHEILNPARSNEHACPFPVLQSDLYSVSQPAQFLLDNHYEVYLWQGWWPQDTEEDGIVKTGSAKMRWDTDRKCAMETVMEYCKEKRPKNPPRAFLIHAGLEPLTFTNLFPYWEHKSEVEEINKEEGRSGDKAVLVKDILEKLNKTRYTLAELKERPLPEGVDPLKLEVYLSDEEFEEILKMPKDEFAQLPAWKQKNLKKNVGLF
ncbi:supervillin-like isoform X2 [Anneissia japonica]|uniref:supervillin-like isoform X2 n=1 Tax=Anneissia japonica TaxID=1529436 RepID=UPI001425864D|nr:supervillin-like isoform X2 [Anneissia japonica]